MVYLKNTTDAQVLMIPKNGFGVTGDLTLVVMDTTDRDGFTLSATDLNTSDIYFNLAVTIPDNATNGEYQYRLMDGQIQVSCGLLIIGDLQSPYQHEETIKYHQYESE